MATELAAAFIAISPSMDGFEKTIKKQLGDVDGKPAGDKIGGGISAGVGGAVKVGMAAVAGLSLAAAAAGAGLTKAVIGAFADYEQNVGGIETMFKGSSATMVQYAQDAYKTAGLSANEYMSQATSFSAALLQSTGQDTAAPAMLAFLSASSSETSWTISG